MHELVCQLHKLRSLCQLERINTCKAIEGADKADKRGCRYEDYYCIKRGVLEIEDSVPDHISEVFVSLKDGDNFNVMPEHPLAATM